MRYVYLLAAFALGVAAPISAQTNGLAITNYQFQSETKISTFIYDVTYSATLINTSQTAKGAVTAHAVSRSSAGDVVAGKDTLHFGPISPNGQVDSSDTFTLRVDRSQTFFFAQLTWTFDTAPTGPTANAGPAQTATVGSTVTLNGSGSTSPAGALSYSWSLTTKPAGSSAALTGANTVSPSFVMDKPGNFVATLTVNNGAGSSTATTTINWINSPPIANAGADQGVHVGDTVTLNGSGSTDVDGNPLTYSWTITSKPTSGVGSSAVLSSSTAVSPSFVADRPGTYVVKLIVNDGTVSSSASTVTINTSLNTAPVSNAGPAQSGLAIGSTVHLDGSGSTDVDGNPLTYQWSLITLPAGSTAVLSSATAVSPTFVADKDGTYVAQLIVNDGTVNGNTATVAITTTSLLAPTSNAGPAQTVSINSLVHLSGSGTDPQSLPLTYLWSMTSKPSGSSAALSSTTAQNPTFSADKNGDYVIQLIVNNGTFASQPATVKISTTVSAPTANAGAAQTLTIGSSSGVNVNLSGTASTDPQSLVLTYAWSLTSKPANSTATLTGATTVAPAFVADKTGDYVAQLIVNNGFLASAPATVMIHVNSGGAASITATSGTPQSANLNAAFGAPLKATVKDIQGNPIGGVAVTFSAPASGASGTFAGGGLTATVNTGSDGVATSPAFTANGIFGNYNVAATVVPVPTAAAFIMTNRTPGPSITAVGGTPQSVQLRAAYQLPLQAKLLDPTGNPVVGATVTFNVTATTGGAGVSFQANDNTGITDASGVATSRSIFSSSAAVGTITVSATATGVTVPAIFNLSVLAGPPDSFSIVSGTPQQAPAKSIYPAPFVVVVKDAQLNLVQGATVRFTAPASGPGGSFPGGQNQYNAITDANGVATAGQFLANANQGLFTVSATVSGISGTLGFSLQNTQELPAKMSLSSGSPQTAAVGAAFSAPLVALVLNGQDQPAAGITVNFTAPTTGATGTFAGGVSSASVITTAAGLATSPVFTAGCTTGAYSVSSLASGAATPVTFALTNIAATASSITVSSGGTQSAAAAAAFASPLAVLVKDTCGNPVPNVVVTFAAPATGASGTFATANTATTGANGIATSNVFTANTKTGSYTVTATIPGVATPANFSLTNNSGGAATITVTSGTPQSVAINTAFPQTLSVTVKDVNDNLVPNTAVTFTAPAANASGTFAGGGATATVNTNASGVATSPVFTSNSKAGAYSVTAAAGAITGASFALTNTVGPVTTITATAGASQVTPINTAFDTALQVTVKDVGGNGVPNVVVTFVAPGSGASAALSAPTATTDASGVASVTATANGTASAGVTPYSVTASVTQAGVSAATFSLRNRAGAPTTLTVISGTPQSTSGATAFANRLVVKLTDISGNAVDSFNVTFTAPAQTGASATFTGGVGSVVVQTAADGTATSPIATPNAFLGTYNVVASVTTAGVAPVNLALTNQAGPPSSITKVVATDNQQAAAAYALPLAVVVKDAGSHVLSGVVVTFTAPSSGASGTFATGGATATATTDATGTATAPVFTANATLGAFSVAASVTGVTPVNFSLTNIAGNPAALSMISGTPQNAIAPAAFAAPLVAKLTDAAGHAIAGFNVTFTAPGSGASATFPGGVTTVTVATAADGTATSPAITPNSTLGSYIVAATVVTAGVAPANYSLNNIPGPPASITKSTGDAQHAAVTTAFGTTLAVIVKDSGAHLLSGIPVTFTAPATGAGIVTGSFPGSAATVVVNTDTNGVAAAPAFTANTVSSTTAYNVTASVTTVGVTPASFGLFNDAGPAATMTLTGSGTPQAATVKVAFANPLAVIVKDAQGNLVVGSGVTFTAPISGASATFTGAATTATINTGANGIASTPVVAGGITGTYSVTATLGALPAVTYTLTNNPGPAATITIISGDAQTAVKNTSFGAPLVVKVKDSQGNAVAVGTVVTFAVPASGASAIFGGNLVTAATIADGTAISASLVANGIAGGPYPVTASVAGVATPASFSLTNAPPPLASITAAQGSSQNTSVNTDYPSALKVVVKDTTNTVVPGVVVTFTAPALGASVTFPGGSNSAQATTDSSGIATSPIPHATGTVGGFTVVASAPNLIPTALFSLNNTAAIGGNQIALTPASVGKDLLVPITMTFPGIAPSGAKVTISSSDSSKVLVSTRSTDGGAVVLSNIDVSGVQTANLYVHGISASGSATVTVSSNQPGWIDGTATITTSPSGFVLAGPNGVGTSFQTNAGASTTLTVNAARLDSASLGYIETQSLRTGVSASVIVTPTAGTIATSPVAFAAGDSSKNITFQAGAQGAATITAAVPTGFSAPNLGNVLNVDVQGAGMSFNPSVISIGMNRQTSLQVKLTSAAASGMLITVTSADPSKLTFAKNPTDTGTGSIVLAVPQGGLNSAPFYAHGMSNAGTANFSATSNQNFGTASGQATLTDSGVAVIAPGNALLFNTVVGNFPTSLKVDSVQVLADGTLVAQDVAGGQTLSIALTLTSPTVGNVNPTPVAIAGGSNEASTSFTPTAAGNTDIVASIPSGSISTGNRQAVSAIVGQPNLLPAGNAGSPVAVGKNLEMQATVLLGAPAPSGGLDVTLVSGNTSVLKFSADGQTAGVGTLVVHVAAGTTSGFYYLLALTDSGSATYTANAPNYNQGIGTVSMNASGFALAYPAASPGNFFGTNGGTTGLGVYPVMMDSVGTATAQTLQAGQTVTVNLSSTNPGVGSVPASVTLTGGSSFVGFNFTGNSSGNGIVSISTPAGYVQGSPNAAQFFIF